MRLHRHPHATAGGRARARGWWCRASATRQVREESREGLVSHPHKHSPTSHPHRAEVSAACSPPIPVTCGARPGGACEGQLRTAPSPHGEPPWRMKFGLWHCGPAQGSSAAHSARRRCGGALIACGIGVGRGRAGLHPPTKASCHPPHPSPLLSPSRAVVCAQPSCRSSSRP